VDNAAETLQSKELQAIVNQEVQSLPEKMREVYLLYIEQHRSVADIARVLSLSEQTVRNQLGLARTRLKKSLQHAMLLTFLC